MMPIKFDPEKFRALLDESAEKMGITVERAIEDIDRESASAARSSLCLSVGDLLEPQRLSAVQREHIEGCDFCVFFIRFWYTRYIVDEEVLNLLSSVADKIKEHPHALYVEMRKDPPDKDRVLCFAVDEMVNFSTVSAARKDHLAVCGECSVTMKLVRNMETPTL